MTPADAKPANGFLNGFLSVLFCIVMFLFSCALLVLMTLRVESTAYIIRQLNITGMIEDTDISYYILSQLDGLPFHDSEILLSDVEDFIKSDAVTDEIIGVLNGYARAFSRGDLDYYLTTDDIYDILQNLEPELYVLFNHHMTDADNEHFARTIDDILGFRGLTVGGIIYDSGIDSTIPFLLVSNSLLWGVALLCFITLLAILFHHKRRAAAAFLFAGIPIILSGLVYLAAGVIFGYYPQLLGYTLYSLARLAVGLAYPVIRYGVAFAIFGVVYIVMYFLLRKIDTAIDI